MSEIPTYPSEEEDRERARADARELWAVRVLRRSTERRAAALHIPGDRPAELMVLPITVEKCIEHAEKLVAADATLNPDAPHPAALPAYKEHANGHMFTSPTHEGLAYTNCDKCGEQYGARYTRACGP